ncbi:FKBP-type peptidyl-prolyl cis-trans isomerase [Mucilaginibacter terrae]|uniref:peptidylprolyl isomerase n=1 Tax=Mucilaginibacter terrae TaxID=1955052 RepID=A0ABU3GX86_9SPHI|nr:FKBP-type peptidyl-prolyl cis-trans isomerase [Mucilaginibacter terrae]MDT3404386.1 FKBP-type peptidyl-prolyl cis-trans isomerase FkpA [Mucilaginibacter terrae]
MRKSLMLLTAAAIGLASCNSGFKKGEGGLLYTIHEDKDGAPVKEGDFISVNLIAKTDADSVLFNSYDTGKPMPTLMPKPQFKGDIYAGISKLSEGDSATFKINTDSMFKASPNPRPANLKGKYIIYQVKVVKIIPKGKLTDQVFQGRVTDYFKAESAKLKGVEPGKISKYIADNNIKATKTSTGLQYQITKPGTGATIAKGDTAVVNYVGRLTTGKVFDTSIKEVAQKEKTYDAMRPYQPIRIAVGAGAVIPGWDEGLQLLNKGAKATLVIPSSLAYGEQGLGPVPPFAPIVFEVELVDIVKPKPGAVTPPTMQLPPPTPAPTQK